MGWLRHASPGPPVERTTSDRDLARRALIVSTVTALTVGAFAVTWYAWQAVAQVFLAVLFGIFVSEASDQLRRLVPLSHRGAVTLLIVVLFAASGAAIYFSGKLLADQFSQLLDQLPAGIDKLKGWAQQQPWLSHVRDRFGSPEGGGGSTASMAQAIKGAGNAASRTLEAGVNLSLVLFAGFYIAYNGDQYKKGTLKILPPRTRPRAASVMAELWDTLWLWTLGRLLVMGIIAASHIVLYAVLGVPLATTLGLIAGLLSFVPNVGPILATIPAGLIALTQGPQLVLWVVAGHAIVQTAESYLLTPVVQNYMVEVPPLIGLAALLFFGLAMGTLGMVVATPLAAVAIVLVKRLYIEGILEEKNET